MRKIRSFVRRCGRITTLQRQALEELWPKYGLGSLALDQKLDIDLTEIKNKSGLSRVVLELGFGDGRSLIAMAQDNPDVLYIGIEVHIQGIGKLLCDLEHSGITNIKIICTDGQQFITEGIADDTLDGVQIFFPDPWSKKRHHKRRLLNHSFLQILHAKINPGGFLHIATDWQDYAQAIHDLFNVTDSVWLRVVAPKRPKTKYEQRGERLGHTITDFYCRRI